MKKLKRTYLRSGRVIGAVLLLLMIVAFASELYSELSVSSP